jgi:dipeptidyl aminopeptidase/acylaminoacyl peptidase
LPAPGPAFSLPAMIRILAALAALAADGLSGADTPLIPIEALFGTHSIRSAQLSPDGKKVAFLAPSGDTYSLALLDLETHKVTVPVHPEKDSLQSFYWKGNENIVFEGLIGGNEVPQVAVTDLEGKRVFSLLRAQTSKLLFSAYSGFLLSERPEDPDHVYAVGYTLDSDYSNEEHTVVQGGEPMVIRIDLHNGHRSLLCPAVDEDPNASLGGFSVDHAGQIRTAVRTKGDFAELLYRDDTHGIWRVIKRYKATTTPWDVRGFTADNHGIYILDYESADTGALRVFDPSSDTLGPPLFTPKEGEIGQNYPPASGLIFAPRDGRLVGIRYTSDKTHVNWLDPKFASLQAKLEHSLTGRNAAAGYIVAIASFSDDESRVLVLSYSDRDPGAFYLLDLNKGTLGLVSAVSPQINPASMAPMLPISFAARDGLEIHGYLTLPVGSAPGAPLPLILHPHGGPFGPRDVWHFDREVQFLANRGYAVLQVNFRGSGGYGGKFLQAGYREWGGKMQDDLTDGVKWAIAKGYADPKRIAIFGASYGGYATLAGLVYTPELYKCGINYVGVSDLVELTRRKYQNESAARISFDKQAIGENSDLLYQRSPVNFVERIRVPLLNAYGENDPRVDVTQWVELKSKLEKYHKTYEYILAKDEGHGFTHPGDAVAFYSKVEAFLKANL